MHASVSDTATPKTYIAGGVSIHPILVFWFFSECSYNKIRNFHACNMDCSSHNTNGSRRNKPMVVQNKKTSKMTKSFIVIKLLFRSLFVLLIRKSVENKRFAGDLH